MIITIGWLPLYLADLAHPILRQTRLASNYRSLLQYCVLMRRLYSLEGGILSEEVSPGGKCSEISCPSLENVGKGIRGRGDKGEGGRGRVLGIKSPPHTHTQVHILAKTSFPHSTRLLGMSSVQGPWGRGALAAAGPPHSGSACHAVILEHSGTKGSLGRWPGKKADSWAHPLAF